MFFNISNGTIKLKLSGITYITLNKQELNYKASCRASGNSPDKKLLFREHIDYVVKRLNKFCGLIYRVRHFYPRYCLLMFYNSFAISIICYALMVYDSAAKTNLQKTECAQMRTLIPIFFKNKIDSMVIILADHKILNVFELFMVEVFRELFKQIRKESSLELSLIFTTCKLINTRRTVKGLLDVPYSRTIVKRKSLSNTMIRAYIWLLDFDLIPENLGDLTKNQIKMYIRDILSVDMMNNRGLMEICF